MGCGGGGGRDRRIAHDGCHITLVILLVRHWLDRLVGGSGMRWEALVLS